MTIATSVLFRDLAPSPAIEALVHRWVERLARVHPAIHRCDVVIEQPHRHHATGRQFHVRIALAMPGKELAITHDPGVAGAHAAAHVAIRDAFRVARRQLEDHLQLERGEVKRHAAGA